MNPQFIYSSMGIKRSTKVYFLLKNDAKLPETEVANKIIEELKSNSTNEHTIAVRYSYCRKMIKQMFGDNSHYLDLIQTDKDVSHRLHNLHKKRELNAVTVKIPSGVVETVSSWVNSVKFYNKLAFLLFTSGRRVNEIILGKFRRKKYNYIALLNPSKGYLDAADPISFPCLINNKLWLSIYDSIQPNILAMLKAHGSNKVTVNTVTHYLADSLKKNFPNQKINPHKLRHMYAAYSLKFRNSTGLAPNAYIRQILNHNTLDASINYHKTEIDIKKDILKKNAKKIKK